MIAVGILLTATLSYAQSGNVGVGTSTPSTPLQVVGTVSSTSATTTAGSTESTLVPPGGLELFRSTGSTSSNVNGYIDFKDNSAKDFDLRLLYDHTLGTNGGFQIVTSTNGGTSNAPRLTVLNSDGRVGIGTTAPDASAKLDVSSTSQGVLVPRMTFAQRNAIGTPATGLMVYQTDSNSGFWHYDGVRWAALRNSYGNMRTVTTNTTLNSADQTVAVNAATIVTVTLFSPSLVPKGYQLNLINMNSGSYGVVIGIPSGMTVISQYGSLNSSSGFVGFSYTASLVSDGNNTWYWTAGQ